MRPTSKQSMAQAGVHRRNELGVGVGLLEVLQSLGERRKFGHVRLPLHRGCHVSGVRYQRIQGGWSITFDPALLAPGRRRLACPLALPQWGVPFHARLSDVGVDEVENQALLLKQDEEVVQGGVPIRKVPSLGGVVLARLDVVLVRIPEKRAQLHSQTKEREQK